MDVFETESLAFKGFCVLLQKHALVSSILPSTNVHTIIINKDISNNHFLTEMNKVTLEIETKLNLKQNKNKTKMKSK